MISQEVMAIRLVLSAVLGGLIGFERQIKHHPVGMRTNLLVCMAAAMVMMLSQLMMQNSFEVYGVANDPRLAAQVITGMGFLGAGTIMHANSTIKGLTTAASLWSVACIGLAIGAGYYDLGVMTAVLVLIVLSLLNYVTKHLEKNSSPKQIVINARPDADVVIHILKAINSAGVDTQETETRFYYKGEDNSAEITFITENFKQSEAVLKALKAVEGITEIRL
ncbi:MAG: MgtC/SapB family protein [Oscillospiraceae bacterium]